MSTIKHPFNQQSNADSEHLLNEKSERSTAERKPPIKTKKIDQFDDEELLKQVKLIE
jgi:hypothetical protein